MNDLQAWFHTLSSAEQAFLMVGGLSNLLFLFYIVLQWAGADHDAHFGDTDFTVFSLRSLLAFGMFTGWTALAASRSGIGLWGALLLGLGAGWLAAWLAWRLLRLMLRLESSGTLDIANAYGQLGTVYVPIAATEQGKGKVLVIIQGAERELDAITEGNALPTGTPVVVVGTRPGSCVVVSPTDPI